MMAAAKDRASSPGTMPGLNAASTTTVAMEETGRCSPYRFCGEEKQQEDNYDMFPKLDHRQLSIFVYHNVSITNIGHLKIESSNRLLILINTSILIVWHAKH
jgi:hypothetical protein